MRRQKKRKKRKKGMDRERERVIGRYKVRNSQMERWGQERERDRMGHKSRAR